MGNRCKHFAQCHQEALLSGALGCQWVRPHKNVVLQVHFWAGATRADSPQHPLCGQRVKYGEMSTLSQASFADLVAMSQKSWLSPPSLLAYLWPLWDLNWSSAPRPFQPNMFPITSAFFICFSVGVNSVGSGPLTFKQRFKTVLSSIG